MLRSPGDDTTASPLDRRIPSSIMRLPFKLRKLAFLPTPTLPLPTTHRQPARHPTALHRPPTPSSNPATSTSPEKRKPPKQSSLKTALILQAVPFLWGTYPPLSYYLTHLPNPPPQALLNLLVYIFSLLPLPLLRPKHAKLPYRAGAELGTYLFLGTVLLLSAVQHTTAPRAALLVQSTTIFVPLLSYFLGRRVNRRTGIGAAVAMGGVYVLEKAGGSFGYGDGLALLSALCYSVHVLRLETVDADSLPLVEAKTRFQTLLAAMLLLASPAGSLDYVRGLPNLPLWEVGALVVGMAWLGMASTALSTWLQVVGQRLVGGSRAAVFYATQPAWAVALSYVAGLEAVDAYELLGAGMIVAAGLLTGVE